MFATIFRTKNVPEEWTTDYIPNATDEEFVKKNIFLAMDERSKLMADWKSVQPKLELIPYQCVNGSKHQCNPREGATEWTYSVQKDDIVAMMEIIVRCVTSTGKDIQLAKKRCDELRLDKSESIAVFNQHLYQVETELERIGDKKKDNAERVFDLLIQLTVYLIVTEILAIA